MDKDDIRIGGVAIPVTPPKRGLKSVLNYYKRKVTIAVFKVLEALKLVELQSPTLNVHYAELHNGTDLEQKVADLIKDGEIHFDLMSGIGVGYDITFHAIVHLRVMTENYIWRGSRKHLCEVSRQYIYGIWVLKQLNATARAYGIDHRCLISGLNPCSLIKTSMAHTSIQ